jgi:outer membrane immunogenic protein
MRRLFIAVAAMAFTGTAFAADMPIKAAPVVVTPSWTGWYIGVNGGGEWGVLTRDYR